MHGYNEVTVCINYFFQTKNLKGTKNTLLGDSRVFHSCNQSFKCRSATRIESCEMQSNLKFFFYGNTFAFKLLMTCILSVQ